MSMAALPPTPEGASRAKAQIFDDWVATLPPAEKDAALAAVRTAARSLPNVGELLAKELVVSALTVYSARRPK